MCYRAGVAAVVLAASVATQGPGLPAGWEPHGEAYAVALDLSTRHGGKSCVSIRSQPGLKVDDPGSGGLSQFVRADNYRGKRVRFSGWFKVRELVGDAHLNLGVRVDGRDKIGLSICAVRAKEGRTPWTRASVALDVPVDAEEIRVGFTFVGLGRAWIDDATLEVVGPEVASNAMDLEPMTRSEAKAPPLRGGLPLEPRGLGFEP